MGDLTKNNVKRNNSVPIKKPSSPDKTFYGIPTEEMGIGKEENINQCVNIPSDKVLRVDSKELSRQIEQDGINALGEAKEIKNPIDDVMNAPTITALEDQEEIDKISLEEIEKDVSLDTFGSGSGLLDLSLQADDTSLGAILDEIYTPEFKNASGVKRPLLRYVILYPFFLFKSIVALLYSKYSNPSTCAEKWLISLSFWIPRKHREYVRGDILEDCNELRMLGYGEWRIRAHAIWHLIIAVIMLWPEVVASAIGTIARRIWSMKN